MLSVQEQDTPTHDARCIHCDYAINVPADTEKDPDDDDSAYARWHTFPEAQAEALFTKEELKTTTGFYLCINSRTCNRNYNKNFVLEDRIPSLRSNGSFKHL